MDAVFRSKILEGEALRRRTSPSAPSGSGATSPSTVIFEPTARTWQAAPAADQIQFDKLGFDQRNTEKHSEKTHTIHRGAAKFLLALHRRVCTSSVVLYPRCVREEVFDSMDPSALKSDITSSIEKNSALARSTRTRGRRVPIPACATASRLAKASGLSR